MYVHIHSYIYIHSEVSWITVLMTIYYIQILSLLDPYFSFTWLKSKFLSLSPDAMVIIRLWTKLVDQNSKFEFWQNDLPDGHVVLEERHKTQSVLSIVFYKVFLSAFLPTLPLTLKYFLFLEWISATPFFYALLCIWMFRNLGRWIFELFSYSCIAKWSSFEEKEKDYRMFNCSLLHLLKVWRHLTARSN